MRGVTIELFRYREGDLIHREGEPPETEDTLSFHIERLPAGEYQDHADGPKVYREERWIIDVAPRKTLGEPWYAVSYGHNPFARLDDEKPTGL